MNANMSPKSFHWLSAIVAVILILALFSPVAASGLRQEEEPLPTLDVTPVVEAGAPVIVNGHELFRLEAALGSITPTERAALVADHISQLANNPFEGEVEIALNDVQGATEITGNGQVLVSVTDADAVIAGRDRNDLAQEWATSIQALIAEARTVTTLKARIQGGGITLLTILGLIFLIWLVNRFSNWLVDRLDPATESGRLPQTLARSEFYQSGLFSRVVRLATRILKIGLIIFLFSFAIPLVLRSFPQTRDLGNRIGRFVLDPLAKLWQGFVTFLPDLAFLIVLGIITWAIIRLVHVFFREVARGVIRLPSFQPEWAAFTGRLFSFFLIIIAAIIGFTSLPFSQLPVFQGIGAFLALLLTLASSSAIANVISGVILTYTGSYSLGDIVEIQTTRGQVIGKYLLTTRVKTFKNEVVAIPNSVVLSNSVTNFSRLARGKGLTLHTTVTIGYDVPWPKVHELLIGAALDSEDVLKEPPPFVLQTALNDYNVAYELNAFTRKPEILPRLYSTLHENIQDRFNAAGVEIMSPAYTALRDGNAVTLPPDSLPDGYRPQGWRVETPSDNRLETKD